MPIYYAKALLSDEMPMKQHSCPQKFHSLLGKTEEILGYNSKFSIFFFINSSEESTVIGNRVKDE